MAEIVKTTCSGCAEPVTVDIDGGVASVAVKAEGRGSKRVPAHTATADVVIDSDDMLAMWDCPVCGYADSVYATADLREALA